VPEALGNRPSPEQLLVLHAALDEPEPAARSLDRWLREVGPERADPASLRLLPLLYTRLPALEPHQISSPADREFDAVREGLRDMYRGSWQRNQVLFARAGRLIERLEAVGIETLVLKGASLAELTYGDAGARPMEDVDVLVPTGRREEAFELLFVEGWRAARGDPREWAEVHHSLGYAGDTDGAVDLHWFALWQPADEGELWRAAVPFALAGTPTRAPCRADQLLLACVHGVPRGAVPPFRWVADAVLLIRGEGEGLDWDRLVAEAERRRLSVVAAAALAYLREEFAAPVPAEVLARLDAVAAPRHERVAFRAACEPEGTWRTLRMVWDRQRRLRDLRAGTPPPPGFLAYARRFRLLTRGELSRPSQAR